MSHLTFILAVGMVAAFLAVPPVRAQHAGPAVIYGIDRGRLEIVVMELPGR